MPTFDKKHPKITYAKKGRIIVRTDKNTRNDYILSIKCQNDNKCVEIYWGQYYYLEILSWDTSDHSNMQ